MCLFVQFRSALVLAAAFGAVAAAPLPAQTGATALQPNPPAPAMATAPGPIATDELARFGTFLEQHPNIEARLRENPGLTNSPVFLRNHPQIAQFLARHPAISAELATRPRWFVHRELARETGAPLTRGQVAEFDRFLDQHPRVERMLLLHPQLLRQPEFLNHFPELGEYLKGHREIDRTGESRPERPMKAERRN